MKERPILFSAEMVRAILDYRKTMTRRVVKPQPEQDTDCPYHIGTGIERKARICPYGKPGDRLWVRETWRIGAWNENFGFVAVDYRSSPELGKTPWIDAGESFEKLWIQSTDDAMEDGLSMNSEGAYHWDPGRGPCRWRPSIFMPRWASRITLEITNIRVERLQDISEEDAFAEGIDDESEEYNRAEHFQLGGSQIQGGAPAIFTFIGLWDSINAKRGYSWEANPWVWVIEFKKVETGVKENTIAFSCGFCGAPLNADKEQVDAPEGYDPDDYPHDACYRCMVEQESRGRVVVTREIALDAGEPALEGTRY